MRDLLKLSEVHGQVHLGCAILHFCYLKRCITWAQIKVQRGCIKSLVRLCAGCKRIILFELDRIGVRLFLQ